MKKYVYWLVYVLAIFSIILITFVLYHMMDARLRMSRTVSFRDFKKIGLQIRDNINAVKIGENREEVTNYLKYEK